MKLRGVMRTLLIDKKIKAWPIIEALHNGRWLHVTDEQGRILHFRSEAERDAELARMQTEVIDG